MVAIGKLIINATTLTTIHILINNIMINSIVFGIIVPIISFSNKYRKK